MADFPHLLRDLDLQYLPMIFTYDEQFSSRWGGMDIEARASHVSTFEEQVEAALRFDVSRTASTEQKWVHG